MTVKEIELKVPDIGEAKRIEVVVWNVQVGDEVSLDQELCELVTDKAAFPLESPAPGKIMAILKTEGESVHVGETLALLGISGE